MGVWWGVLQLETELEKVGYGGVVGGTAARNGARKGGEVWCIEGHCSSKRS